MKKSRTFNHEKGKPCPVVKLAAQWFGKGFYSAVLWNATCFPFDDDTAMGQLITCIEKHLSGWTVDDLIEQAEREMWKALPDRAAQGKGSHDLP